MDKEVINDLNDRCNNASNHFTGELNKLRTGRAHPSMVEDLVAEAYGVTMPLKQLATITTPEPQLIQISPFDPATIGAISTSIRTNQTLGLNPMDDGRVIRVQIPALTTERRQMIVKQLSEKLEEAMITLRKARHEAVDVVSDAKKDKLIGEDDAKRLQKEIEDIISAAKQQLETTAKQKETEIMTV